VTQTRAREPLFCQIDDVPDDNLPEPIRLTPEEYAEALAREEQYRREWAAINRALRDNSMAVARAMARWYPGAGERAMARWYPGAGEREGRTEQVMTRFGDGSFLLNRLGAEGVIDQDLVVARRRDRLDPHGMNRTDLSDFHPRPGRIHDRGRPNARRSLTFVQEVMKAAAKANGGPLTPSQFAGGRRRGGAPRKGRCSRIGRGQAVADRLKREARERSAGRRHRRVIVKARIVRHRLGSGAAGAHIRYLQRDGTTRDGARGRLYGPERDVEDGRAFVERGEDDRHSFRLIVAPEDGDRLADLRDFTRDVMRQMEADLGTSLEWVAVDHFNTGHPHTHIVIRGRDDFGKDLIIAQDYITDGMRLRAEERATLELAPETDLELRTKLRAEISAERFTRVDRAMIVEAQDRVLDLRPDRGQVRADFDRTLRLGRLQATGSPAKPRLASGSYPRSWSRRCANSASAATSSRRCTGRSPSAVSRAAPPTTRSTASGWSTARSSAASLTRASRATSSATSCTSSSTAWTGGCITSRSLT
jgi:hypothetical protein